MAQGLFANFFRGCAAGALALSLGAGAPDSAAAQTGPRFVHNTTTPAQRQAAVERLTGFLDTHFAPNAPVMAALLEVQRANTNGVANDVLIARVRHQQTWKGPIRNLPAGERAAAAERLLNTLDANFLPVADALADVPASNRAATLIKTTAAQLRGEYTAWRNATQPRSYIRQRPQP